MFNYIPIAKYNSFQIIKYNYNENNYNMIIRPTNEEIFLISSILLETLSTCCLKKTLNNKIWFLPSYLGYGLSFYIFPKSLTQFSLSTAYSIWCGIGIILTYIIDKIIYNEMLTISKSIGCLIIIYGIKLIK